MFNKVLKGNSTVHFYLLCSWINLHLLMSAFKPLLLRFLYGFAFCQDGRKTMIVYFKKYRVIIFFLL
jgi:hypothetical protein